MTDAQIKEYVIARARGEIRGPARTYAGPGGSDLPRTAGTEHRRAAGIFGGNHTWFDPERRRRDSAGYPVE